MEKEQRFQELENFLNSKFKDFNYVVAMSDEGGVAFMEGFSVKSLEMMAKSFMATRKGFLLASQLSRRMIESLARQGLIDKKTMSKIDITLADIQDNVINEILNES